MTSVRQKRNSIAKAAGLAAALAVTLALSSPSLAQDKGPIRFGSIMPLTGNSALFGTDQVKAEQMAVKDINDAGGVGGRKLEMVTLDSRADPQIGISAFNRVVGVEHLPMSLVSWSDIVKATAPIANRDKILALNVGANSPEIARLGDWVYTLYPLADVDIAALAKYTHDTLKKEKAAVLYINNESGKAGAEVYRDVFVKAGGKVVAYEGYDPTATDYTGVLLKVRSSGAEIVHIQGLVSDLPHVIAQMRQLGMQQRVSSYAAGYNPKVIEQLGKAAEGLIVTSLAPSAQQNPNVGKFIERWKKEEGRVPNGLPYTQYTYDAVHVVAKLYGWLDQKKLPATSENLRKALLEIREFDLPLTGKLVIAGHRVNKPVYLMTVKDGKFVQMAAVE